MAGETQFTPEAAKQALGIVHSPDTAILGTANPVLEAAQKRYAAGQIEDSLKVLSGEVLPNTIEDDQRVLIWNLSTKRNNTTQEKEKPTSTNEKKRFDDAKDKIKNERKFLEEGIAEASFVTRIRLSLQKSGPYVDILGAMGDDTARDTYVKELMDTPGYREQLRQLRNGQLSPDKRLKNEGTVNNLELEIAKLSAQLGSEVTQTQVDTARTELDTAKAALTPHTAELIQLQVKSKRLQDLTDEIKTTKEMFNKNKGVGSALEGDKNDLLTQRIALVPATQQAEIDVIDAKIKKIEATPAYANYASAKADLTEYGSLPGEIAALQVGVEPFQQDIQKKDEALKALIDKQKTNITPQKKAEIEADIQSKKGQLADAKATLEAEMIKFSRDVTHMGEDAMEKYVNGALGKLKDMWKDEATKQSAKDTTEEGKLAGLAIEKAYNKLCKTSTKKGELTFFKPDKSKSKILLDEALKAGGGENIAVYLETQTNTSLGLTPEEHTALKEKLKDPEFRKAQSEGLAKQALADYLIAGGRLNGQLVESIATSDFGKALISEGRAKAEAASQQKKDLLGKGVLDKGTKFGEFLKGNWWKFGIGIIALLIILGIISAAK